MTHRIHANTLITMRTSQFDFELPESLVAQYPCPSRDGSRMLVLHRDSGRVEHRAFRDVRGHLRAGDVLVINDSRVVEARLHGLNARTAGRFEILLVEENSTNDWWAMLKPGRRARVGSEIILLDRAGARSSTVAAVIGINNEGHRRLEFRGTPNIMSELPALGEVPLPPYIRRNAEESDLDRYQTVFAHEPGSVAAPTAGLHFTSTLLDQLRQAGVEVCTVTLHVGFATFAPVKASSPSAHKMHEEHFHLPERTARAIQSAKRDGRRVVAVGTTSIRTLEATAQGPAGVTAGAGSTSLFVYPPFEFKAVDVLLTNFHLPRSTLLMLVSAFASPGDSRGTEMVLSAYAEAVKERYRFFSYGDAMLIL